MREPPIPLVMVRCTTCRDDGVSVTLAPRGAPVLCPRCGAPMVAVATPAPDARRRPALLTWLGVVVPVSLGWWLIVGDAPMPWALACGVVTGLAAAMVTGARR